MKGARYLILTTASKSLIKEFLLLEEVNQPLLEDICPPRGSLHFHVKLGMQDHILCVNIEEIKSGVIGVGRTAMGCLERSDVLAQTARTINERSRKRF